jgi:hypothetical protein
MIPAALRAVRIRSFTWRLRLCIRPSRFGKTSTESDEPTAARRYGVRSFAIGMTSSRRDLVVWPSQLFRTVISPELQSTSCLRRPNSSPSRIPVKSAVAKICRYWETLADAELQVLIRQVMIPARGPIGPGVKAA